MEEIQPAESIANPEIIRETIRKSHIKNVKVAS